MAETTVTTVPFSRLSATDEINARAATKDGIDELAASIAAKGLIQPLCVRPADGDRYEVIDGRRRHQAIAKLVKAKTWKKDTAIPVLVRNEDDGEALETSLMANTVRLPMHPIDQHAVFARLADQGKSDADIAARFGITERTVRQHKALGKLAPPIRDAWRKGKIEADVAQAFCTHPDHAVQTAAFERLKKDGAYGLSEYRVRMALANDRPRKASVAPDVLERYVAAGGKIAEDLFSDDAYLEDGALLKKIEEDAKVEKIASLRARIAGEGWGWIATDDELPGDWYRWPVLIDLNDFKIDEVIRLRGEGRYDEAAEAEEAAYLAAHTPEMRARAGVVINYDAYTDTFEIHHGVVLPSADGTIDIEDAIDVAGDSGHAQRTDMETCPDCGGVDSDDCDTCLGEGVVAAEDDLPSVGDVIGGEDDGDASEASFAITGALTERVTTALTLSAAAALATAPMTALRVLLASLRVASYSTPAKITATRFGDRGVGAVSERDFDEELAGVLRLTDEAVIADIAAQVAQSLDLVRHQHYHDRKRAGAAHSEDIAALLAVLPSATFNNEARRAFDAADYFKSATKATALIAIDEMRESGAASGLAPEDVLAGMKKADLATAAAEAARACGWLPPELRNAAYALATADGAEQVEEASR